MANGIGEPNDPIDSTWLEPESYALLKLFYYII
jgi:hypothetical protein